MRIRIEDKSSGLQSITVYRHITVGKKLNQMSTAELCEVIANGGLR